MHFLKRGKAGKRGKKSICIFMFSGFCVHGIPTSEKGRGEARQVSTVRTKGTSQTPPSGRSDCEANSGGLPCLSTMTVQDS